MTCSSDEQKTKAQPKITVHTAKRKLETEVVSSETVLKKKDGRGRPKKDKRAEVIAQARVQTPVKSTNNAAVR